MAQTINFLTEHNLLNYADLEEKAGYSRKFYEEHSADLILHKAAKAAFDELGMKKLPTVKALQAEYSELLSGKKKAYATYHYAKKEMQEVVTAKANFDRLLGVDVAPHEKEKSQEQR